MQKWTFAAAKGPQTVLFLGAHCDDIEIGCGGTVLEVTRRHPDWHIDWIVFSSSEVRAIEARRSAEMFLARSSSKRILINDFRNGFFPYVGAEIKEYFESIKAEVSPDLIFTHYRHDLHQDHRVISELTWNTFRDHSILEYEIVKYDGDIGTPSFYHPLSPETVQRKSDIVLDCFASQKDKHWFSADTFGSLARLRGVECCAASGFAEAFYNRKAVMEL